MGEAALWTSKYANSPRPNSSSDCVVGLRMTSSWRKVKCELAIWSKHPFRAKTLDDSQVKRPQRVTTCQIVLASKPSGGCSVRGEVCKAN